MKRPIRIRKFIVLNLLLVLLLPWVFYVGAHFLESGSLRFKLNDAQQEEIVEVAHFIEINMDKWMVPAWQNELEARLKERSLIASIYNELDQEIYRTASDDSFKTNEQFSIIQDGKRMGRVMIALQDSKIMPMTGAIMGFFLAFFIAARRMRKAIIQPLEEMSKRSRQVATGDFDVELPAAQIAEIMDVRNGFNLMVKGINQSFTKQLALEEERRFMIAAIAHDLRTPLFALRGYLDGLAQGIANTPEKKAKYIAVCKDKSAQLDQLVEDLFTLTKSEYVDGEIHGEIVNVSHLIKRSIDSVTMQAEQKQIEIVADNLGNSCDVRGDAHLLERAMNNLLNNAVTYTPIGGRVTVNCYKDNEKVDFTIQDTGSGFSAAELPHVFEPLYRGETSRSRSTGGAGLGLTIAQRVMRQHKGDLIAKNGKNGGALLKGWIPSGETDDE